MFRHLTGFVGSVVVASMLMVGPMDAQPSQRIRIALSPSGDSSDVILSAIRQNLRRLGDIDIGSESETPQFYLSTILMCENDDCDKTTTFTLSARLTSVLSAQTVRTATLAALGDLPNGFQRGIPFDSIAERVHFHLGLYEREHATQVARFGRDRVSSMIERIIAGYDNQCFERIRRRHRLVAEFRQGDSTVMERVRVEFAKLGEPPYC